MVTYLLISFLLLGLIGVPLAIAFGFSGVISLFLSDQMSLLNIIVQRLTNGMAQYILISIPFFILAGQLMNSSEITKKIFKFANTLVGHIPGRSRVKNLVYDLPNKCLLLKNNNKTQYFIKN